MPGRQIDPRKAERARVRLRAAVARRDRDRAKAEESQDRLYSEVFKASQETATYKQIAADLGCSEVFVHKIIKEQRVLRDEAAS